MDNLQYRINNFLSNAKIGSFKPYYKWIIFNINEIEFDLEF